MFGLLIGTLCLMGLLATLRHRRHARFFPGYGPGFGGWDRYGHEPSFRHHHHHDAGYGRSRLLFGVFRRLDATPGQEKAILALAEAVAQQLRDSRKELDGARRELAAALGGEALDPLAFDAAFARGGELFTRLSRELQHALAELHEVLDPEQRKQLAEWLADGSFSPRVVGARHYGC